MSSFYFWHWRICVLMRLNKGAFHACDNLKNVKFLNFNGWKYSGTNISAEDLKNPETAATYLTSTYRYYTWTRENKGE